MLSKKTKYGLKALIHLSRKGKKEPVLISLISEKEQIPRKFLETILLQLKNFGILGSKMGKGGGYYLLKDPSEISVAKIYRILEGPIAMVPCASLNYYERCEDCADESSCAVSALMISVRDQTLAVYENTSLEDLK